jgi:small redox-active disulfide protein 2
VKKIEVFATGCPNCVTVAKQIERAAEHLGIAVQVEVVEDYARMVGAGVISMPGIAVDGRLVHTGGFPTPELIEHWLRQ